jgi:hypothetical protein
MALTWDLNAIENREQVCAITRKPFNDEKWDAEDLNEDGTVTVRNPVTTALIFATISVGIGNLTEENVGTFCARLNVVQRLHGDMLVGPKGPVPITEEDVFAHVGLKTNAYFTDETHAKWLGRMVGQDVKRDAKRMQATFEESKTTEEVAA